MLLNRRGIRIQPSCIFQKLLRIIQFTKLEEGPAQTVEIRWIPRIDLQRLLY